MATPWLAGRWEKSRGTMANTAGETFDKCGRDSVQRNENGASRPEARKKFWASAKMLTCLALNAASTGPILIVRVGECIHDVCYERVKKLGIEWW